MEEKNIITIEEKKQIEMLNNGLITADKFVNKNYLVNSKKRI